jgi:hypothetical protein
VSGQIAAKLTSPAVSKVTKTPKVVAGFE